MKALWALQEEQNDCYMIIYNRRRRLKMPHLVGSKSIDLWNKKSEGDSRCHILQATIIMSMETRSPPNNQRTESGKSNSPGRRKQYKWKSGVSTNPDAKFRNEMPIEFRQRMPTNSQKQEPTQCWQVLGNTWVVPRSRRKTFYCYTRKNLVNYRPTIWSVLDQ